MPKLPASLRRWLPSDFIGAEHYGVDIDADAGVQLLPGAREGCLVSGRLPVREGFVEAITSWQANAPAGTQIEFALRVEIDGRWTRWWTMGIWSSEAARRRSVGGQEDADGCVATDTLLLSSPAHAVQWRALLRRDLPDAEPLLRGVAVTVSSPNRPGGPDPAPAVPPLVVPELSQLEAGQRGPDVCSAAALTMVAQYWYTQSHDRRLLPLVSPGAIEKVVVPAVYDPVWEGTGNWAFNTAYVASLGLEAYVARLDSMAELASWVAAGVPVPASLAWEPGALDRAPLARSSGHLVVVVGFTPDGDVVVNDPRFDTRQGQSIRQVYRADQFYRAWQSKARGIVYLIYPRGWIE